MFGWLRKRAWAKTGGYTCDGCGKWTPRRKGKARVRIVRLSAPRLGDILPVSTTAVMLDCPTCAGKGSVTT